MEPATPLTSRVVAPPWSNTNTSPPSLVSLWPGTRLVLELTNAINWPSLLIAGLLESPLPVVAAEPTHAADQAGGPRHSVEHEHVGG